MSVGQTIFDKELLHRAVPKKQKELERFAELIAELRAKAEVLSVSELLLAVMEDSGYVRELKSEDTTDARFAPRESPRAARRRQASSRTARTPERSKTSSPTSR